MQFEAIPAELRARPQWVVWARSVQATANGPARVSKVPRRVDYPGTMADVSRPDTWGTFDAAVVCLRANPGLVTGIGYMLDRDDPYVVFDVDGEHKCTPDGLHHRNQLIAELRSLGSYTETSPSGEGLHVWVRAESYINGRHVGGAAGKLGIEVYARQFITCTGNNVTQAGCGIVDAQGLIDRLGLRGAVPGALLQEADDPEQGLHQSDADVLTRAYAYREDFADMWEGRKGCEPGDWSHTFVRCVNALDRSTGSVEQILRLLLRSPMVAFSAPSSTREPREHKARRLLNKELAAARAQRRSLQPAERMGDAIYKRMCQYKADLAEAERVARAAEAEAMEAQLAERRSQGDVVQHLSRTSVGVLDRFNTLLGDAHRVLTPPPGMAGQLVLAAEAASSRPSLTYTLPISLTVLSGLLARAYAPCHYNGESQLYEDGGPLTQNFIVVGTTATGKSLAIGVWRRFLRDAVAYLKTRGANSVKGRMLEDGTASANGLWEELEVMQSGAWIVDEAMQVLNMVMEKGGRQANPAAENFKVFVNRLFDCGHGDHLFQLPRSMASKNAGYKPITKLCVSFCLVATPESLNISESTVQNGALSRMTIVRYQGKAGPRQRYPKRHLSPGLMERLAHMMAMADWADANYTSSPQEGVQKQVRVDTDAVRDLAWELDGLVSDVADESNEKRLPASYVAFSRISQSAMRVACCLAVCDNPHAPTVSAEHYRWAFGYLLQNMASTVSSMDTGESGDRGTDECQAVVRCLREMMREKKYRGMDGVPLSDFKLRLRDRKPFTEHRLGRSGGLRSAIDDMAKDDALQLKVHHTGSVGRPTTLVCPVLEHPYWQQ